VLLVERFAVVGGNATAGLVASFCGETAGQGEAFDAIVAALEAFGSISPYRPYPEVDNRVFDPEVLALVLQELLRQRGVRVLLHTELVDARVKRGRCTECIVSGPSGPEAVRARCFVDGTGEAQLVHRAGFETVKGRPGDGLQLPMSMMFTVRHVAPEEARLQLPPGWFGRIHSADDLPMTSIWPHGPGANAIKVKVAGYDATDTVSLSDAEMGARRRAVEVLEYLQRVEGRPWRLDHSATRIGIREGRRIAGEHVLTVDEVRSACRFDDAIARGVYYLDAHKMDDDKRTYALPPEQRKVPPYQIPFRCLVPRGAVNVLAAGRCLSADQLALSSARVMPTCAMMGQAAGIAAALCAERDCTLAGLDSGEVRRIVVDRGARLDV
jgi:hypothetical protein